MSANSTNSAFLDPWFFFRWWCSGIENVKNHGRNDKIPDYNICDSTIDRVESSNHQFTLVFCIFHWKHDAFIIPTVAILWMDYGKCKAVFSAANCKKREHRQNYCDEIIHKMEAHKMIKDEKTSIRPLDDDDNMFIKYSDIFFPRSFVQIRRSSTCVARYPDTALFISILFTNNSEKRKKTKTITKQSKT